MRHRPQKRFLGGFLHKGMYMKGLVCVFGLAFCLTLMSMYAQQKHALVIGIDGLFPCQYIPGPYLPLG
jgi:hypothetical protein